MEGLSYEDVELLKTVAICLCPFLIAICAWMIKAKLKEDADTRVMVISIDKKLAVVLRDVEYLVHDQKILWQRVDDLVHKYLQG